VAPAITQQQLQSLRLKYNAAYTASQGCAIAIAEAMRAGQLPSDVLRESARKAALEVDAARENLRAAMVELIAPKPAGT